ncbi:alkaline phosphatase [Nocardioides anomalus]|uniref:Alkaline phosphatase n=1 Tax=Nocardioides anomalus TaxID=2712223 RepID=A0A6G6WIL3_9ACTN|nr:alkaline phosphatase [Nocardioides anomalus]QIG44997.1 alkaline phosphatase [Nocardioides anomalus]
MPHTLVSRRSSRLLVGTAALAVVAAASGAAYADLKDTGGANRHNGDQTAEVAAQIKYGKAKNVILFIGDGMGDSEITVARNYLVGANGTLAGIDSLPLTGQYTTYALHKGDDPLTPTDDTNKPDYVPDSAATGTGWATGTKTYNGAIGVGMDGTTPKQSLIEWAKSAGKKTGDITTAEVQDATPAVQLAHVADRGCYTPLGQTVTVDGKAQKKDTTKCPGQKSISEQILDTRADVVMGGGRGWFDAQAANGKSVYQNAIDAGFNVPQTKTALQGVTTADQTHPVLGLFASGNMQTRYKATPATATGYKQPSAKCVTNDVAPDPAAPQTFPGNQPTLAEMTTKSLQLLDNPNGFFLQVEGASIDKQDHAANACGQVGETQDLDEAVQVGMNFAKTHGDTLVIVTADHAHTSQIINAADITDGTSSVPLAATFNLLTADGTTETVAYGTAQIGGSQQHTGTQLRVAGFGPGAANVVGLSDQTDLFNTIKGALSGVGLDPAPTGPVVQPTPPNKACAAALALLDKLQDKLKKAKKKHQSNKIARLKGEISGVKYLSKLC